MTRTNALDTTLEGEWYFGVINREESVVSYSAVAKLPQGGLLLGESPPQLSSIVTSPNAGEAPDFGFDLNVVPGETYQVHYTTNPAGFWFSLTNIVAPASGVIEFVHQRAAENPKLFYRVQQVP